MTGPYRDHRINAEGIAREAGEVLLAHYGRVEAREKGPADLVTDADIASQHLITRLLAEAYPDHALLAEEEGAVADPSNPWCWVVDPLDGTMNFAHGFPFWCVSIGLVHEGREVAGVIYDPLRDVIYSASEGEGTAVDGRPTRVSAVGRMSNALTTICMPTNFDAVADEQLGLIRRFSGGTHSMRRTGSTALNLAMVATGACEVCYGTAVHPWDVAAGIVLVREAGGAFTATDSGPYRLSHGGFLASNALVHAEAAARFAGKAE